MSDHFSLEFNKLGSNIDQDTILYLKKAYSCSKCRNIAIPRFKISKYEGIYCINCIKPLDQNKYNIAQLKDSDENLYYLNNLIVNCINTNCKDTFDFKNLKFMIYHEKNCKNKNSYSNNTGKKNNPHNFRQSSVNPSTSLNINRSELNKNDSILNLKSELKTETTESFKKNLDSQHAQLAYEVKNKLDSYENKFLAIEKNFAEYNYNLNQVKSNNLKELEIKFCQLTEKFDKIEVQNKDLNSKLDLMNAQMNDKKSQIKSYNLNENEVESRKIKDFSEKLKSFEAELNRIKVIEIKYPIETINNKLQNLENKLIIENKEIHATIKTLSELFTDNLEKSQSKVSENNKNGNIEVIISRIDKLEDSLKSLKLNSEKSTMIDLVSDKTIDFDKRLCKVSKHQNLIESDFQSKLFLEKNNEFKKLLENITTIQNPEVFQTEYENFSKELDEALINPIFGNIESMIKGHLKNISNMVIHENNKIITSSYQSIKLWDINSSMCQGTFANSHTDWIYSILILRNSNILVSGGWDNKIKFSNIKTLKEDSKEIDNRSGVNIIIQFDNKTIIVGSQSFILNFYDIVSKLILKKITTDHTDYIRRLLLLRIDDQDFLLTGSNDNSIKIWENNKCRQTFSSHSGRIDSIIQLTKDINVIASADCQGNIIFWKINDDYKILKIIKKADYDNFSNGDYGMSLCEIKNKNILISTCSIALLTFWNLVDFSLIRNVKIVEGIRYLNKLEDDEGLIFNIKGDIIIWR